MKDLFLKDSFLKLISFIVAILLWVYIIAVIDPSVDVTVKDIPIRYTNQDVIEEKGLCLVNDSKTTVELKIRGSRKRLANVDNKNIYATVDLSNISKTGNFSLPIAISIPYEYNEIVSKNPYNASINIDKIITAEKDVKVVTVGNTGNGYIAGTPTVSVKKVMLRGAASIIEKIGSVGAKLDFDDRIATINDVVKPVFLDQSGKQFNDSNIAYDLVSMDVEKVQVECPVYKLKTVPVSVEKSINGNLENYKVSVQQSNITIYAEDEVLAEVEKLETKPLNLAEINDDNNTIVVELIIPDGVYLRDGINEVTVKAEKRS